MPDPFDREAQVAYVSTAMIGDDPALVSAAIKEVATMRRIPCALGANPPLSEIMRALRDLGFGLVVQPVVSLE